MSASESQAPQPSPEVRREVERQKRHLVRGAVDVLSEHDLEKKLARSIANNEPLRVKLGVDPTSSALHLGFTVVLNKLRDFQDLGHQAVLILGDATAMVGDPTGRNKTRPRLTHEEVRANAETYLGQVASVLSVDDAEVLYNSEWLHKLDFAGLTSLTARYTVARMLERDDFSKRYKAGTPVYIHEFLYPLLQGWDSVVVRADVELGGTDQLFNLLVGRDLQQQEGQEPQVCLTTGLLIGLDGKLKMSKSYGNTIGITEAPDEMFIKVMRIDDSLLRDWLLLLTREPMEDIDRRLSGDFNPKDVKMWLGRALVDCYHGVGSGRAAAERWEQVVSRKELPDELPEIPVPPNLEENGSFLVVDLLMTAFELKSRGDARRLMKGGGVTLDGEKITDVQQRTPVKGGEVLKAGKKNVARLIRL